MKRFVAAVFAANGLGLAAFQAAWTASRALWAQGAPDTDFAQRIALTAATAILFGAPPVLLGAISALAAGKFRLWAGAGAGAWSFVFAAWWPRDIPLLPPEAWLAPTILVLLSATVGGWLIDSRHWAGRRRRDRAPENPVPPA